MWDTVTLKYVSTFISIVSLRESVVAYTLFIIADVFDQGGADRVDHR